MKTMKKIVMLGASLFTLTALTACQSPHSERDGMRHSMYGMHHDMQMMSDDERAEMMAGMHEQHHMKYRNLSPEQRAEWEKRHAEHRAYFEQMHKACEGKKAGQSIQLKLGEKMIEGSCELKFQPKQPMMQHMSPMMQNYTQPPR